MKDLERTISDVVYPLKHFRQGGFHVFRLIVVLGIIIDRILRVSIMPIMVRGLVVDQPYPRAGGRGAISPQRQYV